MCHYEHVQAHSHKSAQMGKLGVPGFKYWGCQWSAAVGKNCCHHCLS